MATAAWAANTTKLIYSFGGTSDGEYTDTELVIDNAGNLYGTSVQGGTFGGGTVFQITPAGVHTVLYNFTGGADGGEPYKGVTLDVARQSVWHGRNRWRRRLRGRLRRCIQANKAGLDVDAERDSHF